jgi:4-amino-4-deoxy-L-arabinose transferase-like glycosyltransferase
VKPYHIAITAACLGGLLFLQISSLIHKSITIDEPVHYKYGEKVLKATPTRDDIVEATTMPFSALNVFIPRAIGNLLHAIGVVKDTAPFQTIYSAKFVTIFFSFLLALLVMRWAWDLYGLNAALAALFFYCFDPNIIAHSQLVMTDLYAALMISASCYFFWRFMRVGSLKNGLISAIILGVAQLAKYTCLVLYPFFFFYVILLHLPAILGHIQKREFQSVSGKAKKFLAYSGLFILVSLIIINAGFCFYGTGTPLKKYQFISCSPFYDMLKTLPLEKVPVPLRKYIPKSPSFFKKLSGTWIGGIPLPLPTPYLDGLDHIDFIQSQGLICNIYLLGQIKDPSEGKGFNGYFFWALLYKTPIALQIIFLIACIQYFLQWRLKSFIENEIFLLLPVVFTLIYYNYFITMQFGIRSILFIIPLAWIFASRLFAGWERYGLKVRGILMALLFYFFCSTLSYYPYYISYFNELVLDRKEAYKVLSDSNLYLGGLDWDFKQYLAKHPETIADPQGPCVGHIIVDADSLVGIYDPARYAWLRENFKPVDQLAYAYLIYDVSQADLYNVWLKSSM